MFPIYGMCDPGNVKMGPKMLEEWSTKKDNASVVGRDQLKRKEKRG